MARRVAPGRKLAGGAARDRRLDAWNEISVLQHAPWLGRLFAASILRHASVTTGAHLAAFNLGLKTIPVDRRRNRDRETRLLAIAHGFLAAAEIGLKEHDRLALAKTMMDRKVDGRRTSSKLPKLVELVMAKPLVSAGMVAKTLDVTPQASSARFPCSRRGFVCDA